MFLKLRELLISVGFDVNSTKFKNAETKINTIKKNLSDVGKTSKEATDTADKGMKDVAASTAKASSEAHKANDKFGTLLDRFNSLAAFAGITLSLHSIQQGIDEWKVIAGQIDNVTASQQESVAAQKELYSIAQRTRQSYQSTSELFTSVARNAKELGKGTGEILAFTEDVSRAMILGGGSQESQKAALIQLGQALGSGVLRGEELNSIMEQAPRLAKAIAEGMGTTIGKLRQMGAEGKLTAVDVFNAIRKNSERLKMEMGQIPWTVDQAATKMSNAMGRFFYGIEQRTNVVGTLASGIAKISDYIEDIDIDKFVAGFRLLTIYAAAFFVVSKWSAFMRTMEMVRGIILGIRNAYLAASGAQVAFQVAGAKSAAVALLAMGKFLLIAAAITLVILAIQDFYVWVQGGDSIIGRHLGNWESFVESCKERWNDFTQSVQDFMNMRVIDIIKAAIGWLGNLQDKLANLNVREKVSNWWDENVSQPAADVWNGIWNGATAQGPELTSSQHQAYVARGLIPTSNSRQYNNNSTQTNYINVTTQPGANPREIGTEVAAQIPVGNGDFATGIDNSFPATEVI